MSLKLKTLTLRNFLSIGNVTQTINLCKQDLVLVLGENLDLGGNDNRNAVGKTSIVNGLSYALYGKPLVNVKMDNLINKTNLKSMLVTLTFEVNGQEYKIIRGRKPGILKFIKGKLAAEHNNDIEEMFSDRPAVQAKEIQRTKNYTQMDDEAQGENKQTQSEIEHLIGISHDMFKHVLALNTYVEPFLALGSGAQRLIIEQLLGITKLSEKAEILTNEIKIIKDAIKEEEFKIQASTEANKKIESSCAILSNKSETWEKLKTSKIKQLEEQIEKLIGIDIDKEIALHKSKKEVEDLAAEYRSLNKELLGLERDIVDASKSLTKLDKVLKNSGAKICPTCSQEMDKETHESVHNEYVSQFTETQKKFNEKTTKRDEVKKLADTVASYIPKLPDTFYESVDEAYGHKTTLETLATKLSTENESINPFNEQIESLRKNGLQEINFDTLNELVKHRDHQEFLMKLLTNKDSFIRKKIIDQNLAFLNHRLAYYTADIGLPHTVKFKSDLEVEITLYGKEFDFDNLSRGERTRLILSLSWSFRDVFENLNDKINLMFIDELVDQGIDSNGVESALAILKKMSRESKRNIFLISHRDELISRVTNVMKVIKEGGYTTIESDEAE